MVPSGRLTPCLHGREPAPPQGHGQGCPIAGLPRCCVKQTGDDSRKPRRSTRAPRGVHLRLNCNPSGTCGFSDKNTVVGLIWDLIHVYEGIINHRSPAPRSTSRTAIQLWHRAWDPSNTLWSTGRAVVNQKLQIPHGSVPRAFFGGRHWMGGYAARLGWKGGARFWTAPSMNTGAGCLCAEMSQRRATRCGEGSCIAA